MLSQTLQGLEGHGMVRRVAHDVVPPHVDYSLTEIGEEAAAHVRALAGWVERRLPEILAGVARSAEGGPGAGPVVIGSRTDGELDGRPSGYLKNG